MIIGFTGTSKHDISDRQWKALRRLLQAFVEADGHTMLIHGDCIHADGQAHDIAVFHHLFIGIHPCTIADKRAYCTGFSYCEEPKDPIERNHDIVDKCDLLIACPSTLKEELRSGTWATIRYARKVGRPVIILDP